MLLCSPILHIVLFYDRISMCKTGANHSDRPGRIAAVEKQVELRFNNFRINYFKANGYPSKSMNHYHAHDTYEFFYLCNGERFYYISGQDYCVKRGDVVLINRNVIHKTRPTNVPDYERIVLQIPHDFLAPDDPDDLDLTECFSYSTPVISLERKNQSIIESILLNILDEMQNEAAGFKSIVRAQITQALVFIHRHALSGNHKLIQETYVHKKIHDVVAYIGSNHMNEIALANLAEHFHISKSHLARTFKKVTGLTIVEYLNSVRITYAKRLLRNTEMSISQISSETGFNNVSHFDRTFKKLTGCSPSHFRKLQNGDYSIFMDI